MLGWIATFAVFVVAFLFGSTDPKLGWGVILLYVATMTSVECSFEKKKKE